MPAAEQSALPGEDGCTIAAVASCLAAHGPRLPLSTMLIDNGDSVHGRAVPGCLPWPAQPGPGGAFLLGVQPDVGLMAAGLVASPFTLSGCSQEPAAEGYEAIARRTWQLGAATDLSRAALGRELVRCATLAPSSHNTQCWKFALEDKAIKILPDLSRRCPTVDPDDHHVFVSLGCAAETSFRLHWPTG